MDDDPLLALPARRRIFAYIVDHPGLYLRELQRALGGSMGALEYHLDQLHQAGLIAVIHEENKRFFPARMDAADKRVLALLRQDAPRRLVIFLLEHPGAAHHELTAATGYPASTVSFYLAKLANASLIDREKTGREHRYTLTDPRRAYALLVQYRATFLDRVLDGFLAGFDAVHLREKDRTE
ncbi:MAG: winged helix-turn-helix transcriptional regulator [Thermoplasmatota archaeon]